MSVCLGSVRWMGYGLSCPFLLYIHTIKVVSTLHCKGTAGREFPLRRRNKKKKKKRKSTWNTQKIHGRYKWSQWLFANSAALKSHAALGAFACWHVLIRDHIIIPMWFRGCFEGTRKMEVIFINSQARWCLISPCHAGIGSTCPSSLS